MKRHTLILKQYALLAVIALPLLLAACSEEDTPVTPPVDESALLVQYLEGPNGDYLNTAAPAIVTAKDVYDNFNGAKDWYLIDVRSAADYAIGHAPGTVNVTLADIISHVRGIDRSKYTKIVVICYTGQSAAFGCAMLRMDGNTNAFSMKYGMSSWNASCDKLTSKLNSSYESQFVTADFPKAAAGSMPAVSTGKTTGAEILAVRLDSIRAQGYAKVSIDAATVMANPDQYCILNYWSTADYTGVGHLPGAIQYTPKADLKSTTFLKTLPTNKTIVVYCYTGQTSANVATILRVMGYDAKSLSYGTQGLIADKMKSMSKTCYNQANDCMGYGLVQ
jgi:rhodanese-related sulfurtransferase